MPQRDDSTRSGCSSCSRENSWSSCRLWKQLEQLRPIEAADAAAARRTTEATDSRHHVAVHKMGNRSNFKGPGDATSETAAFHFKI